MHSAAFQEKASGFGEVLGTVLVAMDRGFARPLELPREPRRLEPRRPGFTKSSVDLPNDLEDWVQEMIRARRYRDRTHAVVAALQEAKEKWEKEGGGGGG